MSSKLLVALQDKQKTFSPVLYARAPKLTQGVNPAMSKEHVIELNHEQPPTVGFWDIETGR